MWEPKCTGCLAQSSESVPTDTLCPNAHSCPSQSQHSIQLNYSFSSQLTCDQSAGATPEELR